MGLTKRHSAIKKLRSLVFSPKMEVGIFRKKIEDTFTSLFVPNGVELAKEIIGGIPCTVLTPEVCAVNRIMVYIHGGSFVGGSATSWQCYCASLANASSTKIIVPDFRLAPEFPFPAAIEDLQKVLRDVFLKEKNVLLGADGSGATMALALSISMRDKFRLNLKELVLFSPWLDLTEESMIFKQKKSQDEVMTAEALKRCSEIYTYKSNLTNPLVSPMCVQDSYFENFPSIYFQVGEKEALLADVQKFVSKLVKNNVSYELDVWPDMMPFFQMADDFLSEAHLAIEKVGKHIREID